MKTADNNKASRRSSFTQYFSPSHHHEQIIRKRAQSLNAQAERKNSILRTDTNNTLSTSVPPPASPPILQSSFNGTHHHHHRRQRSKPPRPYHERQVQFVERDRPVHGPGHVPFSARKTKKHVGQHVATYKRRLGRVSRTTGQLYYVEELVPIYPYRSTCFSPPPLPPEPYDDESDFETPAGCFHLLPRRRTSADSDNGHERDCDHDNDRGVGLQDSSDSSADLERLRPIDPLYTTLSEKLTAQWGVFTLNVRFSMFRAQDRVKNGVAWMGDMVRRVGLGRQPSS